MPSQVLTIEPQELRFKIDSSRLFELNQTSYLQLTNPSEYTVLFTIKTTARSKYLVSPVTGELSPNSKVDIAIKPQNVHVDLHETHKFMVRSIIAPEGSINIDRALNTASYDQRMDSLFKCVFESAQVVNSTNSDENNSQSEITEKSVPVAIAKDIEPLTKDAVESFIQDETKGMDDNPEDDYLEDDDEDDDEDNDEDEDDDEDDEEDDDEDDEEGSKAGTESSTEADSVEDLLGSDLQKMANEITHLKEKDSESSNETVRLEEGFHTHQEGEPLMPPGILNGPQNSAQLALMPSIAIAIGMALFGITIGKFLMWIFSIRNPE